MGRREERTANLFQKIKIICWSWNLEPRLIRICRIRLGFSIFPFLDRKYYFSINYFGPKIPNFDFVMKFGTLIISNMWNSMVMFTFSVLDLFFANFIQKICWHFDVTWLIPQRFTRRDLKPVAFLVLPYKVVWLAFFLCFILRHWLHYYLYNYFATTYT